MSDVAALAGVSVQSVSNFTNGRFARLSDDTCRRIEDAIRELGYQVNNSARGLRSSRTNTIGFLVLDDSLRFVADPLTALYLAGIADSARDHGYSVLVHAAAHTGDHSEFIRPISENRVDAVCVLLSGARTLRRDVLRRLDLSGIEHVVFDEVAVTKTSPRAHVVRADQAGGASALVDHLVAVGHRRIAFIAARTPWAVVEQRYDAYRRALRRHGLDHDPEICLFEAGWEPTGAESMVRTLLEHETPPTAVMCGSDLLAIGAIDAARSLGRRVPDDLAVCGFDDFDVSAHVSPALTTVSVPAWEMGRVAATTLIGVLDGTIVEPTTTTLPTALQVRRSA
jgi:DNA-binding LacI/PurR family transcriptional regulator